MYNNTQAYSSYSVYTRVRSVIARRCAAGCVQAPPMIGVNERLHHAREVGAAKFPDNATDESFFQVFK